MPQMNPSLMRTVTVPGAPVANPAQLAVAMPDRPMRVLVENVGPVNVRLAFESSSVSGVSAVDFYMLLTGKSNVFILAPGQKLFGAGVGATGSVSVHTSDALPFDLKIG